MWLDFVLAEAEAVLEECGERSDEARRFEIACCTPSGTSRSSPTI